MRVVAHSPVLEDKQTWNRNQHYKNWGIYHVFLFDQGQPTILISSYPTLLLLISLLAFNIIHILYHIYFDFTLLFDIFFVLDVGLNGFLMLAIKKFYTCNPGICSNSTPSLNHSQLEQQKNFCISCHDFLDSERQHCSDCEVCISNSLFHSHLMKACITDRNLRYYVAIWMAVLFIYGLKLVQKYII